MNKINFYKDIEIPYYKKYLKDDDSFFDENGIQYGNIFKDYKNHLD